ncbi:MAG: malate synthase A [Chlamydiales bacterium]|nr:malate synthase A [Chlamydiia bacterium]MCP5506873.1 malate synthase A [Chlamydiales bacterium]
MTSHHQIEDIAIDAPVTKEYSTILTPNALGFLKKLHRHFNNERERLLALRTERQQAIDSGIMPDFLPDTKDIRSNNAWSVAPLPDDLHRRWIEITGPTERKMVINALNSGANVFMADFEDANVPTWSNMVEGQINLRDAVNETISLTTPEGKEYRLNKEHAILFVRPRGWHLDERHLTIDRQPISGSLFDFGLYLFHNAQALLNKGSRPYFYLPKLESHHEARLWNSVFTFSEEELGLPHGTIRATVLIETILAAFEMEEILYELRDHSVGLNAGRWDYIFSVIKKFREMETLHLPDRADITMTVPFMRAYTELLVSTCHKRGAFAIGGMAAFIPNRKDPEVTERALRKVHEDKMREVTDGCDGTWVAHPDLVAPVKEVFTTLLGNKDNQIDKKRNDVHVTAEDLLNFTIVDGKITEEGVRLNINVAIQYLASWLNGNGAVAINNLMEDAATAEISRAQLWQWLHQGAALDDGRTIDSKLLHTFADEEMEKIKALYGDYYDEKRFAKARQLLEELVFNKHFTEFLTIPAYTMVN